MTVEDSNTIARYLLNMSDCLEDMRAFNNNEEFDDLQQSAKDLNVMLTNLLELLNKE